jgi:hypothetical protein
MVIKEHKNGKIGLNFYKLLFYLKLEEIKLI